MDNITNPSQRPSAGQSAQLNALPAMSEASNGREEPVLPAATPARPFGGEAARFLLLADLGVGRDAR